MNLAPSTGQPRAWADSLRSAIEATVLAHARLDEPAPGDPAGLLRLTGVSTEALRVCEGLQKEAVQQARRAEHSWAELGALMGISRQAVQQRFAPEAKAQDGPDGIKRISWATANNEMTILKSVGEAGYHLVGLGGKSMEVEASAHQWEHRRESSSDAGLQEALVRQGWEYVGRWFPFHYFKRQLAKTTASAAASKGGFELFPKEWLATHAGHEIRVRNSWNGGLKLFIDGMLAAELRGAFAIDKQRALLSVTIEPDLGKPFVVEVFAHAFMSVKVKIVVDGAQIAGDSF